MAYGLVFGPYISEMDAPPVAKGGLPQNPALMRRSERSASAPDETVNGSTYRKRSTQKPAKFVTKMVGT